MSYPGRHQQTLTLLPRDTYALEFEDDEAHLERPETFLNYRYDVILEGDGERLIVPGYWTGTSIYNSASTQSAGSFWSATIVPDRQLRWEGTKRFCEGKSVALVAEEEIDPALCKTESFSFITNPYGRH